MWHKVIWRFGRKMPDFTPNFDSHPNNWKTDKKLYKCKGINLKTYSHTFSHKHTDEFLPL